MCVGVLHAGEVCSRVGSGREYRVRWTDRSQSTVTSTSMFGAFTLHHRLEHGDHVLAARDHDRFLPATVISSAADTAGKLTLKFTDGATAYVTSRSYLLSKFSIFRTIILKRLKLKSEAGFFPETIILQT